MAGKTGKAGFTEVTQPQPQTVVDPFARLKEPFREDQLKQGRVSVEGHSGTYVDWYDICDRIEEVDPTWCHEVNVAYMTVGSKVICAATASIRILDTTRMGHASRVVTADTLAKDGKSTETSALQRAAAKFGLTRYLYRGGWAAPAFKLTDEQLAALGNFNLDGKTVCEWATEVLGRPVTIDGEFTAAELDTLFEVGRLKQEEG